MTAGFTVRDLIRVSLKNLGVLATGENPTAQEQDDAFWSLNGMLDQWSTETLFIYSITQEVFTFISGTQVYSMGPGGTFDTARPTRFEGMMVRVNPNTNSQIDIPINPLTAKEWTAISVKNTTSSWPTHYYADMNAQFVNLYFWPVPNEDQAVFIMSWKPLSAFTSVDQLIQLPPGFNDALMYNLAVRLAPQYGKTTPTEVAGYATSSKMNLKISNNKVNLMGCDPALQGQGKVFNYYTGE